MGFETLSYNRHSSRDDTNEDLQRWQNESTVDYWRHKRMYESLLPFIELYPEASWLTVGDGRYGTDAHYLEQQGIEVVATDISLDSLRKAYTAGFVKNIQQENAEKLSFEDDTFDFVLCKESYHHFPRPALAIYEMIRVAKRGVILIEPSDPAIFTPTDNRFLGSILRLWQSVKNEMKLMLGKDVYYPIPVYEPSGNYVYTISDREIEKIALGLNLPAVAFRQLEDYYLSGGETEDFSENGPIRREIEQRISTMERLTKWGYKKSSLLVAAIFLKELDLVQENSLRSFDFSVNQLERNPYVQSL